MQNTPQCYTDMLTHARLVGSNFKTLRDNKRKLAVNLVRSAVVENYQLEGLIVDSKREMKFPKLDKSEQNQANVFFSALRKIVGAWPALDEEVRNAFLAGEIVFSTLVDKIKASEKEAEKAEAAEDEPKPKPEAEPDVAPIGKPRLIDVAASLATMIDEASVDELTASNAVLAQLHDAINAAAKRLIDAAERETAVA